MIGNQSLDAERFGIMKRCRNGIFLLITEDLHITHTSSTPVFLFVGSDFLRIMILFRCLNCEFHEQALDSRSDRSFFTQKTSPRIDRSSSRSVNERPGERADGRGVS